MLNSQFVKAGAAAEKTVREVSDTIAIELSVEYKKQNLYKISCIRSVNL